MADSNRLHGVAAGNGWKERVEHFLLKKSLSVLSEATPDANELSLAKIMLYPLDAALANPSTIVVHFSRLLVTVTIVSDALVSENFDHTAFSDANFEAQVNLLWPKYAKAVT